MAGDLPHQLSAKYIGSFAYRTVKDRLPVILTKAIDILCRRRRDLALLGIVDNEHKAEAEQETKAVIGSMAKLRNEMQTNKILVPLTTNEADVQLWNQYLSDYMKETNCEALWFDAPWLWCECYMYRRIYECFQLSTYITSFDPFEEQKQESLKNSLKPIEVLAVYLNDLRYTEFNFEKEFYKFVEVCLWGNKCDLSISAGDQNSHFTNPFEEVIKFRDFIVSNHLDSLWDYIKRLSTKPSIQIAIVLDNAGFELYTDLCLVEFLQLSGLLDNCSSIKFYVKKLPWFVSDTMTKDLNWSLEFLSNEDNIHCPIVNSLSTKWINYINKGKWVIVEHDFWTLPHDFKHMQSVAPDLYQNLSENDLILFKGDLNYRKLMGDLDWPYSTPIVNALRGFLPSTLCALRTIKCDLVVGVSDDVLPQINTFPEDWMETGDYAVIQMVCK